MKKSNFIHELYPQGTVLSFLFDKRRRKNRSLAWSVAIRREYWILHLSSSIPHLVVKTLSTKIEMFLADMQGWRGPRQTREIYCKTLIQWSKRTRPFFFKRPFVLGFHCSSELCNCSVRNGVHNEPLFYGNFLLQD